MDGKIPFENNQIYTFGAFRLDVAERRLFKDGKPVPLTRKTFDLLLILVEATGHLKTREELIGALWPKNIVEEQGLTTRMHALRKALGDEGKVPQYIETVRGVGYRFIAPVTVPEVAPAETNLPSTATARKRRRGLWMGLATFAVAAIAAAVTVWLLAGRPTRGTATVIAVMPFQNLSSDKTNAYFASGIQDTILTRLASIRNLRVISRISTESYSSQPVNLDKVADELGATAVLEGSVQKAGNQVLINVQLINTRTNVHVWAATYTRSLNNVFGVEGDVATRVAAALMAKLQPAQAARLAQSPTHNPEAYIFFLKANYNADQALDSANAKNTDAAMGRAIALYHQAIARDPRFALAWARLSILDSYAYWFGIDQEPKRITMAEQAAKRALALDPDLPQAHMAMGYVAYYGREDYATALKQFKLAKVGLPHSAEVIGAIAYIHRRQGKWQEALEGLRQAAALDPRNSRWPNETAITLTALRRYAKAEQQFNQALAIEPHNYDAMVRKIWVLLLDGQTKQARQALAKIPPDIDPQGLVSSLRFEDALFARKPDRALAAIAGASNWVIGADAIGVLPKDLLQAEAWTLKGDVPRARHFLEDACDKLRKALHQSPDNPDLWSGLGLAEAGLGEKAAAIRDGRHATELFPVSRDELAGPSYLAVLAKIYVRLGEDEPALKLLARLLAMPAGRAISAPWLRLDPSWDSIRKDPRFQNLLNKYGTAPAATTLASTGINRSNWNPH